MIFGAFFRIELLRTLQKIRTLSNGNVRVVDMVLSRVDMIVILSRVRARVREEQGDIPSRESLSQKIYHGRDLSQLQKSDIEKVVCGGERTMLQWRSEYIGRQKSANVRYSDHGHYLSTRRILNGIKNVQKQVWYSNDSSKSYYLYLRTLHH